MSASIFKAYDIRGLVDEELTPDFAFATGVAFARFLEIKREPGTVVIGEDLRPSSPALADRPDAVDAVRRHTTRL